MDVDSFVRWLEDASGRISFDVDKAWQAIQFTLVGDAWGTDGPFGEVFLGGEPFGGEVGYGPARWLAVDAVARAANELRALPAEEFARRIDFSSMQAHDIYPQIWDRDPVGEHLLEFVVTGYHDLRERFTEAAATGQGFVINLL